MLRRAEKTGKETHTDARGEGLALRRQASNAKMQIMSLSQRCPCPVPKSCECATHDNSDLADVNLTGEDDPGYLVGRCKPRVPKRWKREKTPGRNNGESSGLE